jgi:hypothetical protein
VSRRIRSWAARQFPFVLPLVVLLLAWPWAVFGLAKALPLPRWARIASGVMLAGATIWFLNLPEPVWWEKLLVLVAAVIMCACVGWWRRPKLHGDWVAEQEKLSTARVNGDMVTIKNYRHTVYRTLGDFDVQFMDRTFDLSQLRTVDLLVVPFAAWRGLAHVFVSFGFADGEYLSVSVEARRENGEPYSPVGGLYRQYEVIYVIGDERDVVGKRAVFQNHPVYLYPMIVKPVAARALLESMLDTANELAEEPQFYHTVTNTCTSNVLVHATEMENRLRRYDFRLVCPGYADGLGVEAGLIEAPDGLEALRETAFINGRAQAASLDDGKAWSAAIREASS